MPYHVLVDRNSNNKQEINNHCDIVIHSISKLISDCIKIFVDLATALPKIFVDSHDEGNVSHDGQIAYQFLSNFDQ